MPAPSAVGIATEAVQKVKEGSALSMGQQLTWAIQDGVGIDHVIHDIALADLL